MPTIVTRGAASARGFGFAGKGLNITEQTFTSSTTWVAPAGVTNLVAVIGRGGSSTSDYQGGISVANVSVSNSASGSGANNLPVSYSSVANTASICASVFNAGGYRQATYALDRAFTFYAGSPATFSWSDTFPYGTGTFPYYLVSGTWNWTGSPLSGTLTYGSSASYYAYGDVIYPGSAGSNTTAFGYTFSGASQSGSYPNATGQSATPVTYTNVAVTPGNSYSISVASGGSVTIQYLA